MLTSFTPKKKAIIEPLRKAKELRLRPKKLSNDKNEARKFLVLPPFPCGAKEVAALLEQWVKDPVIY